jgi:NitT/TauT family transport system substrate-binding protein
MVFSSMRVTALSPGISASPVSKHVLFRSILPLLGILSLFACSKPPEPVLRVATNVWSGYEPLYLARSLGYFDGIPVRLIEQPSASAVSENLRSGLVEAGCLTLDEALVLLQDGVDLRVVLVMDESRGADVLMARPGIERLDALRGKRIGVESAAVGAVMLDAALAAGGLRAEDVRQVPMTADAHLRAYNEGRIDAVVSFEPVRTRLLKEGASVLFDSSRIPGRILDVLVVRADAVHRNPASLRALLRGHFLAVEHMANQPRDASARMSPRLGDDPLLQFSGILIPDVAENHAYLDGPSRKLNGAARALIDLMVRRGLLERPVPFDRLAEPAFLPPERP